LCHDNAGCNMAQVTVEANWTLKCEIFLDPEYSPDLVPSDYHIFVLSDVTWKLIFQRRDQDMVHMLLRVQLKRFFVEPSRCSCT
jgi:hypothetical protein